MATAKKKTPESKVAAALDNFGKTHADRFAEKAKKPAKAPKSKASEFLDKNFPAKKPTKAPKTLSLIHI